MGDQKKNISGNSGTAPETWPPDRLKRRDRWTLEGAARLFLRITEGTAHLTMNATYDNPEPVTIVFARGDRAAELIEAFQVVRDRHLPRPGKHATEVTADANTTPEASPE